MSNKYIMALDVGFAATGVAIFDTAQIGGMLVEVACIRPKKPTGNKHLLVADSDVQRVREMARGLRAILDKYEIRRVVAEIPSGGAQGARANRCMGISTGMIATLTEVKDLAVEWYSEKETRKAGVGEDGLMLLENAKTKKGQKRTAKEKNKAKKDIKERIMERMVNVYPSLKAIKTKADLEHIADACATYEAAKYGNLVRMG